MFGCICYFSVQTQCFVEYKKVRSLSRRASLKLPGVAGAGRIRAECGQRMPFESIVGMGGLAELLRVLRGSESASVFESTLEAIMLVLQGVSIF